MSDEMRAKARELLALQRGMLQRSLPARLTTDPRPDLSTMPGMGDLYPVRSLMLLVSLLLLALPASGEPRSFKCSRTASRIHSWASLQSFRRRTREAVCVRLVEASRGRLGARSFSED